MSRLPFVACAAIIFVGVASSIEAVDYDITSRDIEAVLAIARGPEAGRATFHAPYVFKTENPVVERIEVITERRRVALLAAERIALGDPLFAHGTLRAEEALRPWRRKVALVARFTFPPQNAYILAPPVDIALTEPAVPRVEMKGDTLFALPSGVPGQSTPVVGAVGEALFDATTIGQTCHTIVVRLGGREVARLVVDFGQLR